MKINRWHSGVTKRPLESANFSQVDIMLISMSKSRAYIIVMTTFIVHLVSFGFEVIVGVAFVVRIYLTVAFHSSGHFVRFRQ